jgi:membrane protease YdiL (CAAX protease family)
VRAAIAFVVMYFAFDRLAVALQSTRGEAGLVVCAAIVALAVLAERALTRAPLRSCLLALGLAAPTPRALLAAAALSAVLLACLPLLSKLTGMELALRTGAAWLALGMLAQGGVAEEVLFRGFMYRHLRSTRTFRRAATLSAVPFAAAHVPLFWSLDAPVALLALAMAVAWSWPLAWLFERAGGSIWPGAILHGVIQAGIKVLVDDDAAFQSLAIGWVALGLGAPCALFLLRDRTERASLERSNA